MGYFLLGGLAIALIIPVLIAYLMHSNVFSHALGDANGWLGFWGGYLGALVGAATVYILTRQQLKTQKELHDQNLQYQKELQMDSIKVSADMNDLRQRDLIVANLRIDKIDKIIQDIIALNGIVSERFNVLSAYAQYAEAKEKIEFYIIKELKRRKSIRPYRRLLKKSKLNLKKQKPISIINAFELGKFRPSQTNFEQWKNKILKYDEIINNLKEQETELRNKIILALATIKSESMFVKLEEELDSFRNTHHDTLEIFYELLAKEDHGVKPGAILFLIEKHHDRLQKLSNKTLRVCKRKLDDELYLFLTNKKE